MKKLPVDFFPQYQAASCLQPCQGLKADIQTVQKLGDDFDSAKLPMLDFTTLCERYLVMASLPSYPFRKQAALIRNAGNFFARTTVSTSLNAQDRALACNEIP